MTLRKSDLTTTTTADDERPYRTTDDVTLTTDLALEDGQALRAGRWVRLVDDNPAA